VTIFFPGVHHPHNAGKVDRAFISYNAVKNRKSAFPVEEWILDSAGFKAIELHAGYPDPPEVYAADIKRWSTNGTLLAAVTQDYMCEPFMLAITGLTIADHQRLTIERYDALMACDLGGVYLMPVLQGYAPQDYVRHLRMYGDRIAHGAWVGVGSVCKRNGNPKAIYEVLRAILDERPDLRLHGFGIKKTALETAVRDLLYSADSMAWSYAARREGRDANDIGEAINYVRAIVALLDCPASPIYLQPDLFAREDMAA
jgi:hypothetical protein